MHPPSGPTRPQASAACISSGQTRLNAPTSAKESQNRPRARHHNPPHSRPDAPPARLALGRSIFPVSPSVRRFASVRSHMASRKASGANAPCTDAGHNVIPRPRKPSHATASSSSVKKINSIVAFVLLPSAARFFYFCEVGAVRDGPETDVLAKLSALVVGVATVKIGFAKFNFQIWQVPHSNRENNKSPFEVVALTIATVFVGP